MKRLFAIDRSEDGNILFMVLITVILFAALSYAVTSSSRGGSDTQDEIFRIEIAKIDQFHTNMRLALQRMVIIDGFAPEEIDFLPYQGTSGNVWRRNNNSIILSANNNCTSDACRLFHANGGKVSPIILPEEIIGESTFFNYPKDGHAFAMATRISEIGSSKQDIVLTFKGVSDEFCQAYNETRGLSGSPQDNLVSSVIVEGNFAFVDDGAFGIGDEVTAFAGRDSFCYVASNAYRRDLLLVLIER